MRQKQALSVMMAGMNVFLTGAPGAGKTYVLNEYVGRAQRAGKRVAVTASTGIAATHIGGTTIHSWSGLGIRDRLSHEDIQWLKKNEHLIKRYNSTDVLVIDEVSMLHGSRLDMVNQAAKLLRDNDKPFGGLQVILVGDLFQLPPISRMNEPLDFIHESAAWNELQPSICYITEQHRQADSDGLLELLVAMRDGDLDVMHQDLLTSRIGKKPSAEQAVTRLYSHNVDVEAINQHHLKALSADAKIYRMHTKGNKPRVEQLVKSVLAPEELILKKGAEVMFVANNFSEGFVNGSRGTVLGFKGDTPEIGLTNGRVIQVNLHSWNISEDNRIKAEVVQLPLRLAWAITIHKSQGMSLDAAEVDLSRAFTPGMGYVALSRVRSLDGLYLAGINRQALLMHPQIQDFDIELRQASASLADLTEDLAEEVVVRAEDQSSAVVDDELFEKLKRWRYAQARTEKIAPFMIAHNSSLLAVTTMLPQTPQQLLTVPGFGSRKVELYGPEIMAIVSEHLEARAAA